MTVATTSKVTSLTEAKTNTVSESLGLMKIQGIAKEERKAEKEISDQSIDESLSISEDFNKDNLSSEPKTQQPELDSKQARTQVFKAPNPKLDLLTSEQRFLSKDTDTSNDLVPSGLLAGHPELYKWLHSGSVQQQNLPIIIRDESQLLSDKKL